MIIIGDVHGCYDTLVALLDKLPDDDVCFVGDLIDRGPNSKGVVELVRERGYLCTRGNHEDMAIDTRRKSPIYRPSVWLINGGDKTTVEYKWHYDQLEDDLKWMAGLPMFIDFPDIQDQAGVGLFVSHSGVKPWGPIDNYDLERWTSEKSVNRVDSDFTVLWYRGTPAKLKGRYHVFGHTPRRSADVTDYYAMVDTGCVYNRKGYKYLTAIQYPSKLLFTQENIDTQYYQRWERR